MISLFFEYGDNPDIIDWLAEKKLKEKEASQ